MRLEQKLYDLDSATIKTSLMNEYKFGFILTPAIYEELQKYEESGMKFSEYFPGILKAVDYRQEIAKWNDFWSSQ